MTGKRARQPEIMSAFFDRRSSSYDQHMKESMPDFEDFYQAVADQIPPSKNKIEILDLGCGTGLELEPIFRRCPEARITGIDLSANMLSRLENKYLDRLEQLNLIKESYLDYVPGENQFDYCISVMTMHHLLWNQKQELYRKIRRVIKPSGLYIEGDYVVSGAKEVLALTAYLEQIGPDLPESEDQYHLDLPLTRERQLKLLRNVGFGTVKIVWDGKEAAVFAASPENLQPDLL